MAYILTAIMTGGVGAIVSLLTGSGAWQVIWHYVLYGHLGMLTLALAMIATSLRNSNKAP